MNRKISQRLDRRHFLLAAGGLTACALGGVRSQAGDLPRNIDLAIVRDNTARIQPWTENPRYWQYRGQPVLLLGGSKTDHLFLLDDLKDHLDEMKGVGANYVRNYDDQHWEQLLTLLQLVNEHPRPSNHTKIYGGGYNTFGTGGPEDGIERFWRDILSGSASARFHRPGSGNGLNDLAKACIQAARLLESRIKFWDITPHMELLSDRAPNEAYAAAKPGEIYVVYFTNSGSVGLDLTNAPGLYDIIWISVSMGRKVESSAKGGYRPMDKTLEGGGIVTLNAPYKGGWLAAIVKH